MIRFTLSLCAIATSAHAQLLGTWDRVADMPSSRQEVGVGLLDGRIYVIGGFSNSVSVNTVDRYDPLTDTWDPPGTVPDLPAPQPLNHVGIAVVSGELFAIGGLTQSFAAVDTLYAYSPASNEWEERAPMPSATGANGVAVIDGVIHVAGGIPDRSNFVAYHVASNEWETLPAIPTARDHLVAAAIGGRFHAVGGRFFATQLGAHEIFDPATGMWSDRAPLPTPRGGIAGAVLGGHLFVFGGEGNPADPAGVFDEVEEYDPVSNSWRALEPMPEGRHGIGAAALGGRIFIPGGGPIQNLSDTVRVDAFTPPPVLTGVSAW